MFLRQRCESFIEQAMVVFFLSALGSTTCGINHVVMSKYMYGVEQYLQPKSLRHSVHTVVHTNATSQEPQNDVYFRLTVGKEQI